MKKNDKPMIKTMFALLPKNINGEIVWLEHYFVNEAVYPEQIWTAGEYLKFMNKSKKVFMKANG